MPICIERPDCELIAEQIEITLSEVEERADARIGLPIVIAEVAFKVALERRDAPVGKQLPTIGESLVEFDLHRLVEANGVGEAIGYSVRAGTACGLSVFT